MRRSCITRQAHPTDVAIRGDLDAGRRRFARLMAVAVVAGLLRIAGLFQVGGAGPLAFLDRDTQNENLFHNSTWPLEDHTGRDIGRGHRWSCPWSWPKD